MKIGTHSMNVLERDMTCLKSFLPSHEGHEKALQILTRTPLGPREAYTADAAVPDLRMCALSQVETDRPMCIEDHRMPLKPDRGGDMQGLGEGGTCVTPEGQCL